MDYIDYRTKLGLGFSDKEKWSAFVARIQGFFASHGEWQLSEKDECNFCFKIGTHCLTQSLGIAWGGLFDHKPQGVQRIWIYLSKRDETFADFLPALLAFANNYGDKAKRNIIFKTIENAFKESHIQVVRIEDNDGIFYFPKGAKELDDALVSQPLEWLKDYPEARKTWIEALKLYSSNAVPYDIADKFRKALERFFQEFFALEKNLENLKSVYGKFLVTKGVPPELRNNLESLLKAYTDYNNNNAKHHDKATTNVLEYLMYQTGNIMRLLITLRQEETKDAD